MGKKMIEITVDLREEDQVDQDLERRSLISITSTVRAEKRSTEKEVLPGEGAMTVKTLKTGSERVKRKSQLRRKSIPSRNRRKH
jgi:hypothetical protein